MNPSAPHTRHMTRRRSPFGSHRPDWRRHCPSWLSRAVQAAREVLVVLLEGHPLAADERPVEEGGRLGAARPQPHEAGGLLPRLLDLDVAVDRRLHQPGRLVVGLDLLLEDDAALGRRQLGRRGELDGGHLGQLGLVEAQVVVGQPLRRPGDRLADAPDRGRRRHRGRVRAGEHRAEAAARRRGQGRPAGGRLGGRRGERGPGGRRAVVGAARIARRAGGRRQRGRPAGRPAVAPGRGRPRRVPGPGAPGCGPPARRRRRRPPRRTTPSPVPPGAPGATRGPRRWPPRRRPPGWAA